MDTLLVTRIKIFFLDLFDLISFLFFVIGVVLFIRFFIFNPYTVVGKSMEPTFQENDFIIVDKITPKMGTLERGDIVVFVPEGKDLPFIKRIIGMPDEIVKIIDGNVYICGDVDDELEQCEKLLEYYLPTDSITSTSMCKIDTFIVDEGYFVLGDNRERSTDSRCCFGFGCDQERNYVVYDRNLIGKVALRLYPHLSPFW